MDSLQRGRVARFGVFEADLPRNKLSRRGIRVHIQDKPFQLLTLLLKRPDEIVTREELRSLLWSAETFVEFDEGVNAAVAKLRYALADSADSPIFVETVRGKGYRWIAPVEWSHGDGGPPMETSAPLSTPLGTRRLGALSWIGVSAAGAVMLFRFLHCHG